MNMSIVCFLMANDLMECCLSFCEKHVSLKRYFVPTNEYAPGKMLNLKQSKFLPFLQ